MPVHQVHQQQELHRGSKFRAAVHQLSALFQQQQESDTSSDLKDGVRRRWCHLPKPLRVAPEIMQARKVNSAAASRTLHRFVPYTFFMTVLTAHLSDIKSTSNN